MEDHRYFNLSKSYFFFVTIPPMTNLRRPNPKRPKINCLKPSLLFIPLFIPHSSCSSTLFYRRSKFSPLSPTLRSGMAAQQQQPQILFLDLLHELPVGPLVFIELYGTYYGFVRYNGVMELVQGNPDLQLILQRLSLVDLYTILWNSLNNAMVNGIATPWQVMDYLHPIPREQPPGGGGGGGAAAVAAAAAGQQADDFFDVNALFEEDGVFNDLPNDDGEEGVQDEVQDEMSNVTDV